MGGGTQPLKISPPPQVAPSCRIPYIIRSAKLVAHEGTKDRIVYPRRLKCKVSESGGGRSLIQSRGRVSSWSPACGGTKPQDWTASVTWQAFLTPILCIYSLITWLLFMVGQFIQILDEAWLQSWLPQPAGVCCAPCSTSNGVSMDIGRGNEDRKTDIQTS